MRIQLLALLASLGLAGCSLFRPEPPEYEAFELPGGLVVRDIVVPDKGATVKPGDSIGIHYELRLRDRSLIESSQDMGRPLHFVVGAATVPAGLERGVVGMRLYGRRRLTVPSALAFGPSGRPPRIPPDADVIFDLELMEHQPAEN